MEDVKLLEVCLIPISHSSAPLPLDSVSFLCREKKRRRSSQKVGSALVQFVRRSRAPLEFTLGNTDTVVS